MPTRSSFAYSRRKQLRPLNWPSSRLAPKQLLINQTEVPSGKPLEELIAGEGSPPSDRVSLNSWSPPIPSEEDGNG
jgi:hypothetical protein